MSQILGRIGKAMIGGLWLVTLFKPCDGVRLIWNMQKNEATVDEAQGNDMSACPISTLSLPDLKLLYISVQFSGSYSFRY